MASAGASSKSHQQEEQSQPTPTWRGVQGQELVKTVAIKCNWRGEKVLGSQ